MAIITYPPRGEQEDGSNGNQITPDSSWLDLATADFCCTLDKNEKWALINYYLTLILANEGGTDYTDCTSLLAVAKSYLHDLTPAQAESYLLAVIMALASDMGVTVPATLEEARTSAECLRRGLTAWENQIVAAYMLALIVHEMD